MKHTKQLVAFTARTLYVAGHSFGVFMYESGVAARAYWDESDGSAILMAAMLELYQAALLAYRRRTQKALPPAAALPEVSEPTPITAPGWLSIDTLHFELINSAKCAELKAWCRGRGLSATGKVAQLRARLLGD